MKPLEITSDSGTSGMPWSCGTVIAARNTLSPAWRQTLAARKISSPPAARDQLFHIGPYVPPSDRRALLLVKRRGAGKNHAMNAASVSTLLNTARGTGLSA